MKNNTFRTRNWVSILYPESAKQNWLDILKEQHIQCVISPLHDKDISADGSLKKPHYHVALFFQGVKTERQVQEIFDLIGAIKCKAINDVRAQLRYFCHMDDYDKAQYDTKDIISLGGIDYVSIISSSSDKYRSVREMISFCKEHGITSYSDLLEYASIHRDDWFRCLCDSCTLVLKEYLKSKSWTDKNI